MMKRIAIIDSGSGGLTVANVLFSRLPDERIIYVGDHGNCPYGNKTAGEIKELVFGVIRFLEQFELKMLIVACNTASALMLDELKARMDVPVIGVIEPGAEVAAHSTLNRRIGVIATQRTVESHMYRKLIRESRDGLEVHEQACPKLVSYLENEETPEEAIEEALEEYLGPLRKEQVDTLVMGCTHYPLAETQIRKVWGSDVNLVDPARATVAKAADVLRESGDLAGLPEGEHLFCTTGDVLDFGEKVKKWTPFTRPAVRHAETGE